MGDSGPLGIGIGSPASGLSGSTAISVGNSTNIREAFDEIAGNLLGAVGGDAWIVTRPPLTSSLTLTSGEGNKSRGAETTDGGNGSTALGDSILIPLGVGSATCPKSMAVLNDA